MKKFLLGSIISFALGILILTFGFNFYGAPKIKDFLEEKISQLINAKVEIQKVELGFWPTPKLLLKQISLVMNENPLSKGVINEINFGINLSEVTHLKLGVDITVIKPNLILNLDSQKVAESETNKNSPGSGASQGATVSIKSVFPLSFRLLIKDGWIQMKDAEKTVELKNIESTFLLPELTSPLEVNLETLTKVEVAGSDFEIPTKIKGNIFYADSKIATSDLQVKLGGINIGIQGSDELTTSRQDWTAVVDISDLSKLPELSVQKFVNSLKGVVSAKLHVIKEYNQPLSAVGSFSLSQISGILNYNGQGKSASGPFLLNTATEFYFKKTFTFKNFILNTDLSSLNIYVEKYFRKSSKTQLKADIRASQQDGVLTIQSGRLELSSLVAQFEGVISSIKGGSSEISFKVARTSLSGFENLFLPLSGHPLNGTIELNGSVKGDFAEPQTLFVDLSPLDLVGVKGNLNWQSEDKFKVVNGPLELDAHAVIKTQGEKILVSNLKSSLNLTGLNVKIASSFSKPKGEILKLDLLVDKKGDAIQISKFKLDTFAGIISSSGFLKLLKEPYFNLKVNTSKLDLAKLSEMIFVLRPWHLKGTLISSINTSGNYDLKNGIEKSNISLLGTADLNIFNLVSGEKNIASNPKLGAGDSQGSAKVEVKEESSSINSNSLVPPWPIFKNLSFLIRAKADHIFYNKISMQVLKSEMLVKGGILSGLAQIAKIFNGSINVENITIPLLVSQPTTNLRFTLENLDIKTFLLSFFPEFKDLAQGKMSGRAAGSLPYYQRKDFSEASQISGNFKIKDGFLSTLTFDKMVNQKLMSIPGVGASSSKIHSGGATANIDSGFDFRKATLNLSGFYVLTPEKNELRVSGFIKTNQQMDLQGQAFIANPPVSGSVLAANSDNQHRFILPVHFTGTAKNPEFNLTQDVVSKILSNTARHEAENLKAGLKSNLQDAAKKKLQELFGH